jgi:hypothetical protein
MSNEATFARRVATTQEGHRWWLFTACVLVSLTNELSTAVTNLSLGPMRHDLGASSAVMQMAVTLGKLMLGAFMLAGGVAGDVRHSLYRPMNRRWSKDGKSTWNNSQMETGGPYTLSDPKVANASVPFMLCPGRNSGQHSLSLKLHMFRGVHQSEVSVMSKENYHGPPLWVYRDAASNLHLMA